MMKNRTVQPTKSADMHRPPEWSYSDPSTRLFLGKLLPSRACFRFTEWINPAISLSAAQQQAPPVSGRGEQPCDC